MIARVEPHLAYTAYIFGFQHKYTYFLRTIPDISPMLKRLDAAIDEHFLKPILNGHIINYSERIWISLPPKLGGLGIIIPSEVSDSWYRHSRDMTLKIVTRIVCQHQKDIESVIENVEMKGTNSIKTEKDKKNAEKLNYVKGTLNPHQLKLLEAICEKGASNWLTTMPIKEYGFYLNKQTFWDSVHLRYGIQLKRLPLQCACGSNFSVDHALTCKTGGFISIRHNDVRDFTANVLDEVCSDVRVEPLLVPLSGETFKYKSAKKEDNVRLDLVARGLWIKGSRVFGDVRVFNPLAQCYRNQTLLKAAHKSNEEAKKREYGERVLNVEHGTFTPLVFTCFGGMAVECLHFYNRLSDMLAEKRNISGSVARSWIRTKLSFSLLKTANLCIRGSKKKKEAITELSNTNINMAIADSKLEVPS